MVDQRWPIKVGARWAWQSIKPTPKCPCHMRVLCEKRVLDLVVETRMQQGILGFVKRNYLKPFMYTAQKCLGHLWPPLLLRSLWWFSSEALPISPRVLTNEVNFVGKTMSRIMNFDSLQRVWKYSILYSLEKKWLHCDKLFTKLVFFTLTCDSFKI